MVTGELSNFAAFGFAPISRIAPVGVITVVCKLSQFEMPIWYLYLLP